MFPLTGFLWAPIFDPQPFGCGVFGKESPRQGTVVLLFSVSSGGGKEEAVLRTFSPAAEHVYCSHNATLAGCYVFNRWLVLSRSESKLTTSAQIVDGQQNHKRATTCFRQALAAIPDEETPR